MKRTFTYILLLLLLVAGVVIGYYLSPTKTEVRTETKTIVRVDTLRITEVKEVERIVADSIKVPVLIQKTDTVIQYISLPREQVTYKGEEYTAQVSGFQPSLDFIEVYPKTVTIETVKTQKRSRWGIGLQAGFGFSSNGVSPYVGVGVQYRIWEW